MVSSTRKISEILFCNQYYSNRSLYINYIYSLILSGDHKKDYFFNDVARQNNAMNIIKFCSHEERKQILRTKIALLKSHLTATKLKKYISFSLDLLN